jgi:hypothetical protein
MRKTFSSVAIFLCGLLLLTANPAICQTSPTGLTGSGLTYSTQQPFQLSQLPAGSAGSGVCETITDSTGTDNYGRVSGGCDEVHELAWFSNVTSGSGGSTVFNDLLTIWPIGESVQIFESNAFESPFENYSFNKTPVFNPCPLPSSGSCTTGSLNTDPPFPSSSSASSGVPFAIALDETSGTASVWVTNPQPETGTAGGVQGSLYGYKLNIITGSSFGTLNSSPLWEWNPYLNKAYSTGGPPINACGTTPLGIQGWFPPSFTEPTLAENQQSGSTSNGAVYVATVCAETDKYLNNFPGCAAASQYDASHLVSGILVFTQCPGS